MARTFTADLSLAGMRKLKKELTHYRRVTLTDCLNNFISDLADKGIKTGYMNVGDKYKGYIAFTKEFEDTKYNYRPKILMIGYNAHEFTSIWYRGTDKVEEEVSSILMAEYGSGQHALNGMRGTFPNQTHAFQGSWAWSEEPIVDGKAVNWHISSGERPTMPMWNAYLEMKNQIESTAIYSFMRTNT